MKTKKKRGVEVPTKVKEFTDSVVQSSSQDLRHILSSFTWLFEKGDFYQWTELFDHFDHLLEELLKPSQNSKLEGDLLTSSEQLPTNLLLEILRVSRVILEKCSNKHLFNCAEHLILLLAHSDVDVVISSLQLLSIFMKKPFLARQAKWQGLSISRKIFALSQGWGGKEEGLGLLACTTGDSFDSETMEIATTVRFEFYDDAGISRKDDSLKVIHLPNAHLLPGTDLEILKGLIEKYAVPEKLQFSLLARIRFARAFPDGTSRRKFVQVRLLAFTVLLQSSPDQEEITAFFVNEPEIINELVSLLSSEDDVPEAIKCAAVQAIGALAQDRSRQTNIMGVISGQAATLSSILQNAIVSLTSGSPGAVSVQYAECLLNLVESMVNSSSGSANLREAGLIPILLPILKDLNPDHAHLLSRCVHILGGLTQYANLTDPLFRDLGGLDIDISGLMGVVSKVVERLNATYIGNGSSTDWTVVDSGVSESEVAERQKWREILSDREVSVDKYLRLQPSSPDLLLYSEKLLIKSLLQASTLTNQAARANARQAQEFDLPQCLCTIFEHSVAFGGSVYHLAASALAGLIHDDPTSYSRLEAAGLPALFLNGACTGVIPHGEAISAVPEVINALCLSSSGLKLVQDSNVFTVFVVLFSSRDYQKALTGEVIGKVGTGLEEVVRHYPVLQPSVFAMVISTLKLIGCIGGLAAISAQELVSSIRSTSPDTTESSAEGISHEATARMTRMEQRIDSLVNGCSTSDVLDFLPECVSNVLKLVDSMFTNSENGREFIEMRGVEQLLRLYTLPKHPPSFTGSSTIQTLCSICRTFNSGGVPRLFLSRDVCEYLDSYISEVSGRVTELLEGDRPFSEIPQKDVPEICRMYNSIDTYLSLVSFLAKNLSPLVEEISRVSPRIFSAIETLYRQAQWQLSALQVDGQGVAAPDAAGPSTETLDSSMEDAHTLSQFMYGLEPDRISGRDLAAAEISSDGSIVFRSHRPGRSSLFRSSLRSSRLFGGMRQGHVDGGDSSRGADVARGQAGGSVSLVKEAIVRMVNSSRVFFSTMGKSVLQLARRREENSSLPLNTKMVAIHLANTFTGLLKFFLSDAAQAKQDVSVVFVGKVISDLQFVIFDPQKRSCNTALVNCFYAFGTLEAAFSCFSAVTKQIKQSLEGSAVSSEPSAMEIDTAAPQSKDRITSQDKQTLLGFLKLFEQLANGALLLGPSIARQCLAQPIAGGTVALPSTPEAFVKQLKSDILAVVLTLLSSRICADDSTDLSVAIAVCLTNVLGSTGEAQEPGQPAAAAAAAAVPPAEVASGSDRAGQAASRPIDESMAAMLMDMGFSRERVEDALTSTGMAGVNIAMEWLLSFDDEEDELEKALALSMAPPEPEPTPEEPAKEEEASGSGPDPDLHLKLIVSLIPKVLEGPNGSTFSAADFLLVACQRNGGEGRGECLRVFCDLLKDSFKGDTSGQGSDLVSNLANVLAVVCTEDELSRPLLCSNGCVAFILEKLREFVSSVEDTATSPLPVPKWAISFLLILETLQQVKPLTSSALEAWNPAPARSAHSPATEGSPLPADIGRLFAGLLSAEDKKAAMDIVTVLAKKTVDPLAHHAILQLSASLTANHEFALQFMNSGALSSLLDKALPNLFPGFRELAVSIIRHIMEDPVTLQASMESDLKHAFHYLTGRQASRPVAPGLFLSTVVPLIMRNADVFSKAFVSTCQVSTASGQPVLLLMTESEKEKLKAAKEADRPAEVTAATRTGKTIKVPNTFAHVVDQMMEVLLKFDVSPLVASAAAATAAADAEEKGKKRAVPSEDQSDVDATEKKRPEEGRIEKVEEDMFRNADRTYFVLRVLTECVMSYTATTYIILKRDSDVAAMVQSGSKAEGDRFLHFLVHKILGETARHIGWSPASSSPSLSPAILDTSKSPREVSLEKINDQAGKLVAVLCLRSSQGRRKILSELCKALKEESPDCEGQELHSVAPSRKVYALVEVINVVLTYPPSFTSSSSAILNDIIQAMAETGMVTVLTEVLKNLNLDHPQSPKLVSAIIKSLDVLTRVDGSHGRAADREGSLAGPGGVPRRVVGPPPRHTVRVDPDAAREAGEQRGGEELPGALGEAGGSAAAEGVQEERVPREEEGQGQLQFGYFPVEGAGDVGGHDHEVLEFGVEEEEEEPMAGEDMDEDEEMEEGEDDSGEEEDIELDMDMGMEMEGDDGHGEEEEEEEEEDREEEEDEVDEDEDEQVGQEEEEEEAGVGLREQSSGEDSSGEESSEEESDDDDDGEEDGDHGRGFIVGAEEGEEEEEEEMEEMEEMGREGAVRMHWPGGLSDVQRVHIIHGGPANVTFVRGRSAGLADGGRGDHSLLASMESILQSFQREFDGLGQRTTRTRTPRTGNVHPLLERPRGAAASNGLLLPSDNYSRAAMRPPMSGLMSLSDFESVIGRGLMAADPRQLLRENMAMGGGILPRMFRDDNLAWTNPLSLRLRQVPWWMSAGGGRQESQSAGRPADLAGALERHLLPTIPVSVHTPETESNPQQEQAPAEEQPQEAAGAAVEEPQAMDAIPQQAGNHLEGAAAAGAAAEDGDTQMGTPAASGSHVPSYYPPSPSESSRSLEVDVGVSHWQHNVNEHDSVAADAAPASTDAVSMEAEAAPPVEGSHGSERRQEPTAGPDAVVSNPPAAQSGDVQGGSSFPVEQAIDPTFLEALPEDVRAEVLASQAAQVRMASGPSNLSAEDLGELDAEFLAALPPDIQAEVLAQQRAQRAMTQRALEGQPVDMDSASILATFSEDLREEVLLTASQSFLAGLPPALHAEASLLRERAATQYQSRSHRLDRLLEHRIHQRRPVAAAAGADQRVDAARARAWRSGRPGSDAYAGTGSALTASDDPVVKEDALKAFVRLLRIAQPLGKGLLQRLFLNVCSHPQTRSQLLLLLLGMLRPRATEDGSHGEILSPDGAPMHRLYGCHSDVVYARLPGSTGVPPLVSRRVLDLLCYLSRHQKEVTRQLITIGSESDSLDSTPVLLLKLLNEPLYCRSSLHLEQVMTLLETIVQMVRTDNKDFVLTSHSQAQVEVDSDKTAQQAEGTEATALGTATAAATSDSGEVSSRMPSALRVIRDLPEAELKQLCRILAMEGLSEAAYSRVSSVIKALTSLFHSHQKLLVAELADQALHLSGPAIAYLRALGRRSQPLQEPGSESNLVKNSVAGQTTLRILQALGACMTGDTDQSVAPETTEKNQAVAKHLHSALNPLWDGLSLCSEMFEERLDLAAVPTMRAVAEAEADGLGMTAGAAAPLPPEVAKLLPFMECFFVLYGKMEESLGVSSDMEASAGAGQGPSSPAVSPSPSPPPALNEGGVVALVPFMEKNRRILNSFVRQNIGLLDSSFSQLLQQPRLLDFDNKRNYFRSQLRSQHDEGRHPTLRINVSRNHLLEDSFDQLRLRTPDELRGRLTVQFRGEEGVDAGGVSREWYLLLSRVLFDKGALLFTTMGSSDTFQPNPNSHLQNEYLQYFRFVGRVVAKALFDDHLFDVHFTRSFYKHILGKKVTYHDLEAADPEHYKNLCWVLENHITENDALTFSVDPDEQKRILFEKEEVTDHELIPGGKNIPVTDENKQEYVNLKAEYLLTNSIRAQINAFLEGFNELIPKELISIFNDKELELLISGLPDIDIEDLHANTEYTGYTAATPVVQWFWDVARQFSKEDKARLLQFITGTSKVPLDGFRALQGISGPQRFQIHKVYGSGDRLPSAHTCFNQLDIPEYSSKDQLKDRLLMAIHEGGEGFSFA